MELGDFVVSLVASNRYGLGTGSLTLRVSPVVGWGDNYGGQTNVPSGLSNVVAIAAGGGHDLALTTEGRVVAWGRNEYIWYSSGLSRGNHEWVGQATVPSGLSNVVAIAAGHWHSLALTAEGRVVAWGSDDISEFQENYRPRTYWRADDGAQRVEQRGGDCGGRYSQSGADGRGPGGGVGQRWPDECAQRVEQRGGDCGGILVTVWR